jgi:hypothetical protein
MCPRVETAIAPSPLPWASMGKSTSPRGWCLTHIFYASQRLILTAYLLEKRLMKSSRLSSNGCWHIDLWSETFRIQWRRMFPQISAANGHEKCSSAQRAKWVSTVQIYIPQFSNRSKCLRRRSLASKTSGAKMRSKLTCRKPFRVRHVALLLQ